MIKQELWSQAHEITESGSPVERARPARVSYLTRWKDPRYLALRSQRDSGALKDNEYFMKQDDLCPWAIH